MVVVEVISVNGNAPGSSMEVTIDDAGGTVGRATMNALVLADPARTVSRIHAQFLRRQGVVKVLCRGTNDLLVDGRPVEMGDEVAVTHGTQLQVGAYALRAWLTGSAAPRAPSV